MALKVWGDWYTTAQFSNTDISMPFTPSVNISLVAIRSTYIAYNSPTWTGSMSLKIYSNSAAGLPDQLLATSTNSWTKAQIIAANSMNFTTLNNAIFSLYFNFNYFNLKSGVQYHLVTNGTGYTGSDSSHLAWRKGYPDPVYDIVTSQAQVGSVGFDITAFIGAEI